MVVDGSDAGRVGKISLAGNIKRLLSIFLWNLNLDLVSIIGSDYGCWLNLVVYLLHCVWIGCIFAYVGEFGCMLDFVWHFMVFWCICMLLVVLGWLYIFGFGLVVHGGFGAAVCCW
jgi:hypothetical protein